MCYYFSEVRYYYGNIGRCCEYTQLCVGIIFTVYEVVNVLFWVA